MPNGRRVLPTKSLDKLAVVQEKGLGFWTVVVKIGLAQDRRSPRAFHAAKCRKDPLPRFSIKLNARQDNKLREIRYAVLPGKRRYLFPREIGIFADRVCEGSNSLPG